MDCFGVVSHDCKSWPVVMEKKDEVALLMCRAADLMVVM